MNLETKYLGLKLKNPIIASSSPLTEKVEDMLRLEEAGASAVVMRSLFEEQISFERAALNHHLNSYADSFAEALSFFPEPDSYGALDDEQYLDEVLRAKDRLSIPVIASLNGSSSSGWTRYARELEQAGADAIELNVYHIAADFQEDSPAVETMYREHLEEVKKTVAIPVALKLHPYFSSFASFARSMAEAGADGLVLFNRFYQSDFDLEKLEVTHDLKLSDPYEMRLALRWIGILHGRVNTSLAATTGIYSGLDVLKVLLAGADAAMMASALLKHGTTHIAAVLQEMREWMEKKEYSSVEQLKGSLSFKSVENPEEFIRANYMRTLYSYR